MSRLGRAVHLRCLVATQKTTNNRETSCRTANNSCCPTNYRQTACRTSNDTGDGSDDSADQGGDRVAGATKQTTDNAAVQKATKKAAATWKD